MHPAFSASCFSSMAVLAASARLPTVCQCCPCTVESQTGQSIYRHSLTKLTGGEVSFQHSDDYSCMIMALVRGPGTLSHRHITDSLLFSRTPHSFLAKLLSGLSCYMRSVQPSWRILAFPFAEPKKGSVQSFPQRVKVPWILCPVLQHTDCCPKPANLLKVHPVPLPRL